MYSTHMAIWGVNITNIFYMILRFSKMEDLKSQRNWIKNTILVFETCKETATL